MTQEQIERGRIAIAERCGYWFHRESLDTCTRVYKGKPGSAQHDFIGVIDNETNPLPNYHNNLDAMHEAEKVLADNHSEYSKYLRQLWIIVHPLRKLDPLCNIENYLMLAFVTATAPQRFEAFLKTIGKWEE